MGALHPLAVWSFNGRKFDAFRELPSGAAGGRFRAQPIIIMPNYDYQCEKCGHQFEVFQSMNDAKLTDCPLAGCDGVVKRLLGTGAGLIFKGAGFYQTDYRSASYQAGAKSESSGGGDSKGGDSKGGEKAAAKPAKEAKKPD